jgi:hypothetical protein
MSTHPVWSRLARGTAVSCALIGLFAGCDEYDDLSERSFEGEIVAVVLSPDSITVQVGYTVQFSVYARTTSGDSVDIDAVWQATDGVVTDLGVYTAPSEPGMHHVVAVEPQTALSDTAVVVVVEPTPPPVARVSVTPESATLEAGESTQLTATLRDAEGNELTDRDVAWATSDADVATVSEAGLVTAVAAGTADIAATSEGVSDAATIVVTEPEPPPPPAVVFVGAGDIANCGEETDEATAELLDGIPGTVFTTGDNAYPDGSPDDFAECYEPTWGRHKARTWPSPGNHDYDTDDAAGYFAYFGDRAGPAGRGYYSYDLGAWHIISLNSNVSMSAGSAQEQWLRADLAVNRTECTLAYWHHPRFSSGEHGNNAASESLWRALYEAGVEVILVGHDHNYERFAPQTPDGVADPARGIRQFVVGTGGTSLRDMDVSVDNSEVQNSDTHGVLQLTLRSNTYTWTFIPIAGGSFTDSGGGTCH